MAADPFLNEAIREAKLGLMEGGIPIGSVLVCDGRIIGRGHNRRVQLKSAILHGEMDCLENAGRLPATTYARCTIYTTLSPCPMCSGAIVLYKIPRVVVGENQTFLGAESTCATMEFRSKLCKTRIASSSCAISSGPIRSFGTRISGSEGQ